MQKEVGCRLSAKFERKGGEIYLARNFATLGIYFAYTVNISSGGGGWGVVILLFALFMRSMSRSDMIKSFLLNVPPFSFKT